MRKEHDHGGFSMKIMSNIALQSAILRMRESSLITSEKKIKID